MSEYIQDITVIDSRNWISTKPVDSTVVVLFSINFIDFVSRSYRLPAFQDH